MPASNVIKDLNFSVGRCHPFFIDHDDPYGE